jgi:hypothetical protein
MSEHTWDILRKVVSEAKCKPGWTFRIVDSDDEGKYIELHIRMENDVDNYDHSRPFAPYHVHPVPYATYNEASWRRWLFEQCLRSMNHEIGEALNFNGERPFAPLHGPGEDPYTRHEFRPEIDFLTTQNGSIRKGPV